VLEKNPTASATQHQLEIPALPMRDYGVELVSEPIFAMQADSPASKAGVKVGDRIIEFAGEPLGDPLSFPQRVLTKIGESDVPLVVEREGEKVELKITLREPVQGMWRSSAGNSVGVESMGIAYRVRNEVAHIREKGPAQDKLQPGDQLLKVRFIAATPEQAEIEKKFSLDGGAKETPLNTTTFSWINLLELATHAHFSNTTLEVTFKRVGKEQKVQLTSVDSQETFSDDRNLPCTPYSELHQADSWSEALSLGMREMKERMLEVVLTVSRLIQGKLGLGGTGGPISIIRVASSEASRGLPELLMFFAWLSANLAVMNFLPIPALDGGHMLFLTWEAIMGKPVNENLQVKLSIVGILMLLSLMLFVTVLDITRFF
jgi:regulator of sigma E protease